MSCLREAWDEMDGWSKGVFGLEEISISLKCREKEVDGESRITLEGGARFFFL